MGRFRQFLTEQVGLGDLGPKIDQVVNGQWLDSQIGGALASSDVTNSEMGDTTASAGHPLHLPSTDLTIPAVVKNGRITTLIKNTNPIYLRLSDGTEAHLSYDEFRRIEGTPAIGKAMTITFQRRPDDRSNNYSKIEKAIVLD